MNLFELSIISSMAFGLGSGAITGHQSCSSSSVGLVVGAGLGLACGIGCYRGLLRLAAGAPQKRVTPDKVSSKREVLCFLAAILSPYLSGAVAFLVVRMIFYHAAA